MGAATHNFKQGLGYIELEGIGRDQSPGQLLFA